MDKKFDDLLNGVFGTRASLEQIKKQSEQASEMLTDLEEFSKQMNASIAKNTKEIAKQTNDQMDHLNDTIKKDFTPQKIDYAKIEENIKNAIIGQDDFIHQLVVAFRRPDLAGNTVSKVKNNILVLGNQGTGKNLIIEKLNEQLYLYQHVSSMKVSIFDLDLYKSGDDEKLFLQDLYAILAHDHTIVVIQNFENCQPRFLSMLIELLEQGRIQLSKRYVLQNSQLMDASNMLSSAAISSIEANEHYFICLSQCTTGQLASQLGTRFMNLFRDICTTTPFSDEQIDELIQSQYSQLSPSIEKVSFTIKNSDSLIEYYKLHYDPNFGIDSLTYTSDKIKKSLVELRLQCLNDDMKEVEITSTSPLTYKLDHEIYTIDQLLPERTYGDDIDIQKELDEIVGLQQVKDYVLSLKDHYEISKRRKEQGYKVSSVSKHMIFMGNPGTGKTTIARLLGRYFKATGILESGQLIEVSRGDLVGRYVGHTAPQTKQVFESALGGILFIDEAYSLYRGKDDSFGLEAIDTLVKCIEDYRDNVIVILAGYTKEMTDFLQANSGLKSRFPHSIEFPDYSGEELLEITKSIAKSKDYVILAECDEPLLNYYNHVQSINAKENGNGRMARNIVEQAILNQSKRLVNQKDAPINELQLCDFSLEELS